MGCSILSLAGITDAQVDDFASTGTKAVEIASKNKVHRRLIYLIFLLDCCILIWN